MENKESLPVFHKSVLVKEVLEHLAPSQGKTYVDATFGGGGHTRAILNAEPNCQVIAIDWDLKAIEQNAPSLTERYGNRFKILWGNFAHMYKLFKKEGITHVDGILADFGTSQFQIHERAGFSFQKDTPLDMRMSPAHQHTTAAMIINEASVHELIKIFSEYGEEPKSKTLAYAIVEERKKHPFETTGDLVDLVESLIPVKSFKAQRGIHPATKIFQALRIAVNSELDNIHSFLISSLRYLNHGGRLVCISFHSLEDRMVKNFFKEHQGELNTLTPKPVMAGPEELGVNPSSRSAKLRAAEKI
jgi:16S rRNA (cytosine1402-N4)-methyltransferase